VIDLRVVFIAAGLLAAAVSVWTYTAHPRVRAS
jgi:hypothetical protein